MDKFEYYTELIHSQFQDTELWNEFNYLSKRGEVGFELVSVIYKLNGDKIYYWKRKIMTK